MLVDVIWDPKKSKTKNQQQENCNSIINKKCFFKKPNNKKNAKKSPGWYSSVGWASSHKVKGLQFDSQLGHIPTMQVQSLVRAHTRSNQPVFLCCIDISLPLFLPPSPSLKIIN